MKIGAVARDHLATPARHLELGAWFGAYLTTAKPGFQLLPMLQKAKTARISAAKSGTRRFTDADYVDAAVLAIQHGCAFTRDTWNECRRFDLEEPDCWFRVLDYAYAADKLAPALGDLRGYRNYGYKNNRKMFVVETAFAKGLDVLTATAAEWRAMQRLTMAYIVVKAINAGQLRDVPEACSEVMAGSLKDMALSSAETEVLGRLAARGLISWGGVRRRRFDSLLQNTTFFRHAAPMLVRKRVLGSEDVPGCYGLGPKLAAGELAPVVWAILRTSVPGEHTVESVLEGSLRGAHIPDYDRKRAEVARAFDGFQRWRDGVVRMLEVICARGQLPRDLEEMILTKVRDGNPFLQT